MYGGLLGSACYWLAPESLCDYWRYVRTQCSLETSTHLRAVILRVSTVAYINHTVTFTCSYESRHNTRKSPRPRKRREAPLNRRFLGSVPRQRGRERERADKQQHRSHKLLSPDSLSERPRRKKATRTFCLFSSLFCRVLIIHSLFNAIAEVRSFQDTTQGLSSADTKRPNQGTASLQPEDMYGASGIPELIPPSGPPRQPGPAGQFNPGHPQVNGHGGGGNPQRLGQRAPKLGQIGRTKKVDLEDEDLDDIMNNNGQCPVSLSPIS